MVVKAQTGVETGPAWERGSVEPAAFATVTESIGSDVAQMAEPRQAARWMCK